MQVVGLLFDSIVPTFQDAITRWKPFNSSKRSPHTWSCCFDPFVGEVDGIRRKLLLPEGREERVVLLKGSKVLGVEENSKLRHESRSKSTSSILPHPDIVVMQKMPIISIEQDLRHCFPDCISKSFLKVTKYSSWAHLILCQLLELVQKEHISIFRLVFVNKPGHWESNLLHLIKDCCDSQVVFHKSKCSIQKHAMRVIFENFQRLFWNQDYDLGWTQVNLSDEVRKHALYVEPMVWGSKVLSWIIRANILHLLLSHCRTFVLVEPLHVKFWNLNTWVQLLPNFCFGFRIQLYLLWLLVIVGSNCRQWLLASCTDIFRQSSRAIGLAPLRANVSLTDCSFKLSL